MDALKEMVCDIEGKKEFWDQDFTYGGKEMHSGFEFASEMTLQQILFWFKSQGFHFRKENQFLSHSTKRITLKCAASYKKRAETENLLGHDKSKRKSFTKRLPKERNCSMAISLKKVESGRWTVSLFRNSHSCSISEI